MLVEKENGEWASTYIFWVGGDGQEREQEMPALPSLGKMITPADRKIFLCAGLISFISEKEQ